MDSGIDSGNLEACVVMGRLRKLILWCLLAAFGVSAVGCNTVEGMGRDIERAGHAIQNAVH